MPEISELRLTDKEISRVAEGIPVQYQNQIAVQYLDISQIEADNIYSDCREVLLNIMIKLSII